METQDRGLICRTLANLIIELEKRDYRPYCVGIMTMRNGIIDNVWFTPGEVEANKDKIPELVKVKVDLLKAAVGDDDPADVVGY
jgi:hypothetical protein